MKKVMILTISVFISNSNLCAQDYEMERLAMNGNTEAMYELANCYANGEKGYIQDSIKAFNLMRGAAEMGDIFAMYDLGLDYVYVKGIENAPEISTKWLETYVQKSKDNMLCSTAELELYFRYQDGTGCSRNPELAMKYLFSSVNRGSRSDPSAYNMLGECYYEGNGVLKNRNEAIKYFKLSADAGCGLGMANLGIIYYNEKKFDMAYQYLKKACEDEFQLWPSPKAMLFLSHCYRYGLGGIESDEKKAEYWLNQSAINKEVTAIELIRANR